MAEQKLLEAADALLSLSDSDEPKSLHAALIVQLRAIFLRGELPSGSRISETQLCERFSISRTPLREALKVLASEGFVTLRPNRGAIVAPIAPELVAPLFAVKGALERLIGLDAAESATEDEIREIESVQQRLEQAVTRNDRVDYTRLNYLFHKKLTETCRNPVLFQHYETLQQQIWRYRFTVNELPERLEQSSSEHRSIVVALRARARLDLAERLEVHNQKTGEAISLALKSMP